MGTDVWAGGNIMSGPAAFWLSLLPPNSDGKKPSAKRHEYCKKVLDVLKELQPELHEGTLGATLTADEAQQLLDTLQKNSPGHIFKHRVSYLIRGLEQGRMELGWDVVIPDPPFVIPRERPFFTHDRFALLPDLYRVESAFLRHLKSPSPATYTTRIGQLLLSAMLFGGLVRKKWLTAWVEALATGTCDSSVLWLDMVLKPEHSERERRAEKKTNRAKADHSGIKEPFEIRRRWFADPLTQALIIRWSTEHPEDINAGHIAGPMVALRHYLDLILPHNGKTSNSDVKTLLNGCAMRLGLQTPSFLRAYAEGKLKSVSLSPAAWFRLLTGKTVQPSKQAGDCITASPPVDIPLSLSKQAKPAPMVRQEEILKEVLTCILPSDTNWKRSGSEARESLLSYYAQHQGEMCEALSCLLLWCIDLLTAYNQNELIRGRSKSKLRASSVRGYLSAIGKRLVGAIGTMSLLELDGDELHDLYAEVIESCPTSKSKHWAGDRIYAFHQFLMIRLGAPQVDFSDLRINSGPAELAVDANLISLQSFEQIKKVLCPDYAKASRLRKIQLLTAIIAFRCGLRRSEVMKLRLIDVQGVAQPELLVRNNRYAYVKSNESIRRLPLGTLLEADELNLLLSWQEKRTLEDGGRIPEALLFCEKKQPTMRLSSDELFPPIMQAVHQVTGDTSLVFHHFRHSFATWLLLRLLTDFSDETRQRFHFLQHPLFSPDQCASLRTALLGNQTLGRQALYATAQLCGHNGPEVTLLHYVHLCDWLLAVDVSTGTNQPALDAAAIMAVTGLPPHQLYYDKKTRDIGLWQMSLVLDRLQVPGRLKPQYSMVKPSIKPVPEKPGVHPDTSLPLWKRVFAVIRERQIGHYTFSVLSQRSGFDEAEIKAWCSNLEQLAALKTRKGEPRHITKGTLGNCSKENRQFHFPQTLRLQEDRILADTVLSRFEASHGNKRQKLIQGAVYFCNHFTAAKSAVRCLTPMDVKNYLRFLHLLQIPAQQIHVSRVQARSSKLSPAVEKQQLTLKFGLPESSVTVFNHAVAPTYKNGYYQIQVMNNLADKRGIMKANYGFRFAMYMIAVMSGLGDEMISTPRTQAA